MRSLLLGLCVSALVALPGPARADTTQVIDGTIADGTPRYFAVPFTVPAGTREIEVRHDDLSTANILDWGLRDPERFRGWGGGNTESAVVGEASASRSYLAGALPAGTWSVLIGQAQVAERPARYHLEITLRTAPTLAAQPERAPYSPPAAPLATGARWYAGDFHVHSRESGDAQPTLDAIATFARGRGLDFVELSDHNTVSQLDFINAAQARHPDLLFVPGIEVTTYWGHANAIGATHAVDFTIGSSPAVTIDSVTDAVAAQGAPFAINHPVLDLGDLCIGCAWSLDVAPARVAAIEVQNGAYSVTGALFYRRSLAFWETYSARGFHVAPLGGSDDHRAGMAGDALSSPIGSPTTMVYATELSARAIAAGVAAGRTVVKLQGPDDPMIELSADGGAMVGDTLRVRRATLSARVTHGANAVLRWVHNGVPEAATVSVSGESFGATREVVAPAGSVDDRWRCDLLVSSAPRVVTGHIWVAATGEPVVPDAGGGDAAAGGDARADAGVDSGTGGNPRGGCGCRATTGSGRGAGALAGVVLAVASLLSASRRRSRAR